VAPQGLSEFQRHGGDFVLVWDPEDPATDLVLRAAYSAARALAVREAAGAEANEVASEIDRAVRAIEKRIEHLVQVKTWAETIASNSTKILDSVRKVHGELEEQVEAIDAQVAALRRGDGA
jgi:hypothetical protein